MCFQASRIAFCPQLVQVVPKAQEVKLCGDIRPAPGEEALEFAIVFQGAKSALHLNGAIDPKDNPTNSFNVLLGTAAEPKQIRFNLQLFRFVVFRLAADLAARAA